MKESTLMRYSGGSGCMSSGYQVLSSLAAPSGGTDCKEQRCSGERKAPRPGPARLELQNVGEGGRAPCHAAHRAPPYQVKKATRVPFLSTVSAG